MRFRDFEINSISEVSEVQEVFFWYTIFFFFFFFFFGEVGAPKTLLSSSNDSLKKGVLYSNHDCVFISARLALA